jgi:8-oxo-dGTP pyrophosphatase MutT (NUDIX family)
MIEGKMTITLDQITRFFAGYERRELQKPHLKNAAVLMLFYPKAEALHVLLTKRTEDVEHHKGQISFPGGSRDKEDHDLVKTALRESEEEIGLAHDAVQVLGVFDDFETPSGFAVTPVVAYAQRLPPLSQNTIEVAEILEVPVSIFLDKRNERIEKRERLGTVLDVYFYRFGEYEIWGATAAILRAFLNELRVPREN